MIKHGTYRLDAPPPFQGVWRATVDRVHYRFNTVRLYLLACGDCREVYLRHLQDNEYAYSGCYYHRGVYCGFCPFAGSRYVFDDTKMHASRVQVPVHALQKMREAHERKKKEKEPKPESVDIPFASSPLAMSSAESLDNESESASVTIEPVPMSSTSSYSIPSESDADPDPDPDATPVLRSTESPPEVHAEHADSTDSLLKSPFSDCPSEDERVASSNSELDSKSEDKVAPCTLEHQASELDIDLSGLSSCAPPTLAEASRDSKVAPRTSEHQATEQDINPFLLPSVPPRADGLATLVIDGPAPTTSAGESLTTQHAPDMLELLHAASSHAATQARALADLRAVLAALETQLIAAQEQTHTLEVTVSQQAHRITSLEAEAARDNEKTQRLRAERRRLLHLRERMFEAFGLHDPEKWDADDDYKQPE